jgi:hypothetical protein
MGLLELGPHLFEIMGDGYQTELTGDFWQSSEQKPLESSVPLDLPKDWFRFNASFSSQVNTSNRP